MMRGILVIGGMLLLAGVASADVNCKQVKKYLDTGRSVQDVAETMVISEADVKNCQEKLAEQAGGEKKEGGSDAQAGQ